MAAQAERLKTFDKAYIEISKMLSENLLTKFQLTDQYRHISTELNGVRKTCGPAHIHVLPSINKHHDK